MDVHHGILRIAATHNLKQERPGDYGVKYLREERHIGSVYRQLKLPPTADLEHVEARIQDGVLTVRVGKRQDNEAEQPKAVCVA